MLWQIYASCFSKGPVVCLSPFIQLNVLQEEEKKATQAATTTAGDDGITEMIDDGMMGMTAAQQAQQAALKRSKATKERALLAAKQKQKDVLDTRRMPMVS